MRKVSNLVLIARRDKVLNVSDELHVNVFLTLTFLGILISTDTWEDL